MLDSREGALLFTTSTSSRGSFHRNLYLLDVSITLAAEYLREQQRKDKKIKSVKTKVRVCSLTPGGSMVWKLNHDSAFSTSVSVCMFVCVFLAYRLMELRLNEPDFLLRVVQMIRSLKRKSERSFFPPTVFYRERREKRRAQGNLKSHPDNSLNFLT